MKICVSVSSSVGLPFATSEECVQKFNLDILDGYCVWGSIPSGHFERITFESDEYEYVCTHGCTNVSVDKPYLESIVADDAYEEIQIVGNNPKNTGVVLTGLAYARTIRLEQDELPFSFGLKDGESQRKRLRTEQSTKDVFSLFRCCLYIDVLWSALNDDAVETSLFQHIQEQYGVGYDVVVVRASECTVERFEAFGFKVITSCESEANDSIFMYLPLKKRRLCINLGTSCART
jgi:hypothetical protein